MSPALYETTATRTGSGLLIALLMHVGFLTYAYLRPMPPEKKRSRPIVMEVITRPKPAPPRPPEVTPPPPPPAKGQTTSRPLPRELQPVPRKDEVADPKSSAIVVPPQPPGAAEH